MQGRAPFLYLVFLLAGIVIAAQSVAFLSILRYGGIERNVGWEIGRDSKGRYIESVDPLGPSAGKLKVGDRLVAINGDTRVQQGPVFTGTITFKVGTIPVHSIYTIRVLREQTVLDVPLTMEVNPIPGRKILLMLLLGAGLICMLCGLLVGMLRPDQRITQLLSIACIGAGAGSAGFTAFPLGEWLHGWEFLLSNASIGLLFPASTIAFDFYHRFPPGVIPGKLWSRFRYLFYPSSFATAAGLFVLGAFMVNPDTGMNFLYTHYQAINLFWKVMAVLVTLLQTLIVGVLIRNYRAARELDQRRRTKWVFFGAIAGTFPSIVAFLLFLAPIMFGINLLPIQTVRNLFLASACFIVLIPISVTYSVLKHRVMDINVVVRRGLQYLLARNVLQLILILPVAGIAWNIFASPDRTLKEIMFNNSLYFYGLLFASCGLLFRAPLRRWIDRKFFRESYDREQILTGLIEEVKKLDSVSEISKLVSKELQNALHPKAIYFFFHRGDSGEFSLGYSSEGESRTLRLEEGSAILRTLENEGSALQLPLSGKHELPAPESEWLSALGLTLMVPMMTSDQHLAGVVFLGEKRSEEPYTPGDCKLLSALAAQIAMVHETATLKARIGREQQVRSDVLARLDQQSVNLLQECPACHRCFDRTTQTCAADGNKLELSLPVERTIDGKYRLDHLIGKGGMGAVYEAQDLRLDRKVAVKIMLGGMFGDQTALRRFEREARASARLNHPNIISVYDYGAIGSSGAFLVMELAQGRSMRAYLQRGAGLDPAVVADWFDQLLEGIQTAHEAGIVHRDLKPENVLVMENAKPGASIKILDFGLAKLTLPDVSSPDSLTAAGTVLGTLHYMSPEQLSGQEVDEGTDIFALGVMLVETLTGARPFEGKSTTELVTSILQKPYHLEGNSREEKLLDELLQKCLAKSRSNRFRTVAEMRREVASVIRVFPRRSAPTMDRGNESKPTSEYGSEIETRDK